MTERDWIDAYLVHTAPGHQASGNCCGSGARCMVSLKTLAAPYTSSKCAVIRRWIAPSGQREDDLVDPVQRTFPFGHDHRLEGAVPIAEHLNLDRANLRQHSLRPGAIAHVRCDRCLAMLVPEVIGQLGFVNTLPARSPARSPVSWFSSPPGPTRLTPCSLACASNRSASSF